MATLRAQHAMTIIMMLHENKSPMKSGEIACRLNEKRCSYIRAINALLNIKAIARLGASYNQTQYSLLKPWLAKKSADELDLLITIPRSEIKTKSRSGPLILHHARDWLLKQNDLHLQKLREIEPSNRWLNPLLNEENFENSMLAMQQIPN